MIPGEYFLSTEPIEINAGRPTRRIEVTNRGDRPVQVGSHCHFFEVNRFLDFDREAAYGMRLNIAAGTAVRFEPGDTRDIELVAIGGRREVAGLNRLVDGALDAPAVRRQALERCHAFTSACGPSEAPGPPTRQPRGVARRREARQRRAAERERATALSRCEARTHRATSGGGGVPAAMKEVGPREHRETSK